MTLLQVRYLPVSLISGSFKLLQAMSNQLFTERGAASVVLSTPFRIGGLEPESAARRALAISYITATPNFIGSWGFGPTRP